MNERGHRNGTFLCKPSELKCVGSWHWTGGRTRIGPILDPSASSYAGPCKTPSLLQCLLLYGDVLLEHRAHREQSTQRVLKLVQFLLELADHLVDLVNLHLQATCPAPPHVLGNWNNIPCRPHHSCILANNVENIDWWYICKSGHVQI